MPRQAYKQSEYALRVTLILCLLFGFFSYKAFGDLATAIASEEKAKQTFRDQFKQFTTEKNVMGRATDADGKAFIARGKARFNPDDDNNFENDLTYHDNMFELPYQTIIDPTTGQKKTVYIQEAISQHGTISASGGSSPLERKAWELEQKLKKQDENLSAQAQAQNDRAGITFDGAMKTTRLDLIYNPNQPNQPPQFVGPGATTAPDVRRKRVERRELRDEVKTELEKVGTNSGETIIAGARDSEAKNNSQVMPNLTFMYEAAKRAVKSFWTSSLANLAQRRASENGGIRLNEDTPTCEVWQQKEVARITKEQLPQDIQKRRLAELERQTQDCKKLAEVDFEAVNPQLVTVTPTNAPNPNTASSNAQAQTEIKQGDFRSEDGIMRDNRAQLGVLADIGKSLKELPTNWGYKDSEEKAKVVLSYDDKGNPAKEANLTMREQVGLFNDERKGAQEDIAAIEKVVPKAKFDKSNLAPIDTNDRSVMELSELPQSMKEELASKTAPDEFLDSYSNLIKANSAKKF